MTHHPARSLLNFVTKHNVRRSGEAGKQTLILGHGFGTDQAAWEGLRPWLDQYFDVVSYDLAGAGPAGGESYDLDRHSAMFGYADDLTALLDEMQLRDCLYIGHSMSGMIGALAAIARPELFKSLIMIGASPCYLNESEYSGGFDAADLDALFAAMAANYQAWVSGFAPMVVGVDDSKAVADFSRSLFSMRPDIALRISRMIFTSDLRAMVPAVPVPVHLIQTAKDVAVPQAVGQWLAKTLPQASLDLIQTEGHLPHITSSEAVRQILAQRLQAYL